MNENAVVSFCSVFGEIKKEAIWEPKDGVQILPEHSEQVQGAKDSYNRCSVFREIKEEANSTPKHGVQRLLEHSLRVQGGKEGY